MVESRMKHAGSKALPPAPAPTSRDANPWAMPGAKPPQRIPGLRIDPARLPERLKVPPSAPAGGGVQRKHSKATWVPFLVIGGIFVAFVLNALESFRDGDYVGALLPFVFVGIVVAGMVRNLLRPKR